MAKNVEDELFELLNSPDPVSIGGKTIGGETAGSAFAISTASYEDSQDFLSWLEESPPPKKAPEITLTHTSSFSNADLGFLESLEAITVDPPALAADSKLTDDSIVTTSPSDGPKSVDSIYNEMFGTEKLSTVDISPLSQAEAFTLETELDKIISSPFPDVGKLREFVDNNGYIPNKLRVPVLLLLLTGSCHMDDEAEKYKVSETEKEFYRDLASDIQSLSSSCYPNPSAKSTTLENDVLDIVVLYCQRRSIDYKNIFSRILVSIFGETSSLSKSLVSSCFYALTSNFLPLLGLQYTSLELAVDAVHSWLRLLVTYHSPALAQHLDRVLPGWEKSAKEISTAQSSKLSTFQKASSALDSLEKELGIDLGFDFDADIGGTAQDDSSRSIESAPPKASAFKGMIPTHWITAFFAGSVPAAQSAALLDWSVFNGERFAGVYYIASLLEIHASALLQMNAAQITQWFDDITHNKPNWFRSVVLESPQLIDGTSAASTTPSSWGDFVEAWIHATAVLVNNTPHAFRDALMRTETWAAVAAEKQHQQLSQQLQSLKQTQAMLLSDSTDGLDQDNFFDTALDEHLHGATGEDAKGGKAQGDTNLELSDGEDDGDDGDEDDANSDVRSQASSVTPASTVDGEGGGATTFTRRASSIMDNLRTLTAKIGADFANGGLGGGNSNMVVSVNGLEDENVHTSFLQDRKLSVDTLCLWTEATEVLPSIVGGGGGAQRRGLQNSAHTDVRGTFANQLSQHKQKGSRYHHRLCFFLHKINQGTVLDSPVYFAIDCRSAEEQALGLFPKAYNVAPDVVTDGDGLTHLLQVLEPLKNSVHISIIGAGTAYHRWQSSLRTQAQQQKSTRRLRTRKQQQQQQQREANALKAAIQEEHARCNAIASFLIKRAFRHISVLDGGFVSAAQALTRPDSRHNLASALVDSNRLLLHALLGIPDATASNSTNSNSNTTLVKQLESVSDTVRTQAPQAIKTVGSLLTTWVTSAASAATSATSSSEANTPIPPPSSSTASSAASSNATAPPSASTASVSAPSIPSGSTASTSVPASVPASTENAGGFRLAGWGSALGKGLDTLKKGWVATTTAASAPAPAPVTSSGQPSSLVKNPQTSFIIDDDEESDNNMRLLSQDIADSHAIGITRTDQERAQALAMHRMAGLKKGDAISITRTDLPGAILFPASKQKVVWVTKKKTPVAAPMSEVDLLSLPNAEDAETDKAGDEEEKIEQEIPVARYLVVSRERFIVLDAGGGGVGAAATVKSNHHLTELIKMTFKKKDPELVTLHLVSASGEAKPRQYRVAKYQEFVATLQKNMERFKI